MDSTDHAPVGFAVVTARILREGLPTADMLMGLEEMPEHTVYRTRTQGFFVFVWRCECQPPNHYVMAVAPPNSFERAQRAWFDSMEATIAVLAGLGIEPTALWDQMGVKYIGPEGEEIAGEGQRANEGERPDTTGRPPAIDGEEDAATRGANAWYRASRESSV